MNTEFSLRICPSGIGIYRDNKRFATVGVTVKTEEREAHLADTKAVGVNRFMLSDGDVRAELRFISGSSLVCFAEVKSEKTPLSAETTFGIGFSFENGSAKATTTQRKNIWKHKWPKSA